MTMQLEMNLQDDAALGSPSEAVYTPVIRFKGFSGVWVKHALGSISDVKTGPFGSSLHADDYVEDGEPIITTEHFKTGILPNHKTGIPQVSSDDYSRLKSYLLQLGDIVFSRVGSVDINAHITSHQAGWLFSGRVLRVRTENSIDSEFLHHELSTSRVKKSVVSRAVGQTMPSINTEILKITPVYLPPETAEQTAIGNYFQQLDSLIAQHQHKHTKLLNLKQALLQKMFPKQGATVPEVRFKGFSGDWEVKSLGDLCEQTYGGGTPTTTNLDYWDGEIPWIQSSDLSDSQLMGVKPRKNISEKGLRKSATKLIPSMSIAIVTRVGVGKVALMQEQYATSQDFVSLSNLKINPIYGVYVVWNMLQTEKQSVQGTSIKGITKDELLSKSVKMPNKIEEQTKIGQLFQQLDHLINQQHALLTKLGNLKQAYLAKMFI